MKIYLRVQITLLSNFFTDFFFIMKTILSDNNNVNKMIGDSKAEQIMWLMTRRSSKTLKGVDRLCCQPCKWEEVQVIFKQAVTK